MAVPLGVIEFASVRDISLNYKMLEDIDNLFNKKWSANIKNCYNLN